MLGRVLWGGGLAAVAVIAFLVVLRWPSQSRGPIPEIATETMCEVELGPERCPAKPDLVPGRPRIFFDRHANAHRDIDVCMLRARDYAVGCKSKSPVTARFYRGREVVRTNVYR